MNALSDQLRRRIAALRPDWNPAEVSGFIYLEGGYSNDNYRFEHGGERYVLRAPTRPRAFVDRRLELGLYQNGAAADMPELVAFDADSGHMITRWVAGAVLADRHPAGAELVAYLSGLHRRMPPMTRICDPLAQAREHLAHARAPRWLQALGRDQVWKPDQLTPCHNDLNPWNVICTPAGRWVTLDWEWAGLNDPLFDLVTLHQAAALDDAELPALGAEFLRERADPARLERCLTVFWLRETAWALAEIAAGNDRPEVIEQSRLGSEKLRRLRTGR